MIRLSELQEIFCRLYREAHGIGFHHKTHYIYQNRQWLLDEISIMLEDMGKTLDLQEEANKIRELDKTITEKIIEARKKARPLTQKLAEFLVRIDRNV